MVGDVCSARLAKDRSWPNPGAPTVSFTALQLSQRLHASAFLDNCPTAYPAGRMSILSVVSIRNSTTPSGVSKTKFILVFVSLETSVRARVS